MRLDCRAHSCPVDILCATSVGLFREHGEVEPMLHYQPAGQRRHVNTVRPLRGPKSIGRRRDLLKGRATRRALCRGHIAPRRRFRCRAVPDDRDHFSDLCGCPGTNPDFGQAPSDDCLHLDRDLVRLDFEQIVAFLDLVTD